MSDAFASRSSRCSSTKRVCTVCAANSGCAANARNSERFVASPSIRHSPNAPTEHDVGRLEEHARSVLNAIEALRELSAEVIDDDEEATDAR